MKIDDLFLDILLIQSPSRQEDKMIAYLESYAIANNYTCRIINRNVYMTKGRASLYPCFVAHTDTCASIIPQEDFGIFYDKYDVFGGTRKKNFKQTQVGFDDKVGIFLALQMMKSVPHAKAFFPYCEEVGCIGSSLADMTFFDDCCYVIQCDRSGSSGITDEIGWTEVMSDDFKKAIASPMYTHKRKFVTGMQTDVKELKEKGLNVVCMNIECGYYRQHSNEDYVNMEEMDNTLSFVTDIVNTVGIVKYEHIPTKQTYNWDDGWLPSITNHKEPIVCDCCGQPKYTNDYYEEFDAFICRLCYWDLKNYYDKSFHELPF